MLNLKSTWIERILAGLAAINCLAAAGGMAFSQTRMAFNWSELFPFPILYLIEIAVFGLLGLFGVWQDRYEQLPWLAAGVLLAFVILGAWSIGPFLILPTLLMTIAGYLQSRRTGGQLFPRLAVLLAAGLIQASMILFFFYMHI